MRAVLQRVASAAVAIDGKTEGSIGRGLLVLAAVGPGDTDQDFRPSFHLSAPPEEARTRFELFHGMLEGEPGMKIPGGQFGADMQVSLVNDGPVTILRITPDVPPLSTRRLPF